MFVRITSNAPLRDGLSRNRPSPGTRKEGPKTGEKRHRTCSGTLLVFLCVREDEMMCPQIYSASEPSASRPLPLDGAQELIIRGFFCKER